MSLTRPSAVRPEDLEKLLEKLLSSGAPIAIQDARMTALQTKIQSSIGALLIALGGWGIKSINDLNQTMTRVVTQNEYRDARVDRVERHIETVDGRVVILERMSR